jgi:hypothetical protein
MNKLFLPLTWIFPAFFLLPAAHAQVPGDDCRQQGRVRNGIVVNLPPSGVAEIEACWFAPFDCANTGGFSYSFSDNPADTKRTVSCIDLGQNNEEIWVWDAAGNASRSIASYFVQDFLFICPGQTPACSPVLALRNGLTLALPETGEATLSARQFDLSTYLADCPPGTEFTFSFSDDPADSLRTFTCDDNPGPNPILIWATTSGGQQAIGGGVVLVQDNVECQATPACAPQLLGVNGMIVHLSSAGEAALKPEDFLLEVKEICPGGGALQFSFSPDVNDNRLVLGCADMGQNPFEIWVTDELGRQNSLNTFAVLQDLDGVCNEPVTIAFSPNDMACDAEGVDLTPYIDAGPVCYNNVQATAQPGEPAPPNGDCFAQDAWCDGGVAHNSVWFVVTAPAGGSLRFETEGALDMQLAVWQASSCDNLLTGGAQLIGANDDRPGDPYGNARLDVHLTPGGKYYVQADGHGSALEAGVFYLSVSTLTSANEPAAPGEGFALFPNPAQDWFTVRLDRPIADEGFITLYDAAGGIAVREILPAGSVERLVRIDGLAPGMYFCRVAANNGLLAIKKIVVF